MNIFVDPALCISCSLCINTCPDVFTWNDEDQAEANNSSISKDNINKVREAIDGCPTEAIKEK